LIYNYKSSIGDQFAFLPDLKTLTLNIRCKVAYENEVVNDVRDVLLRRISRLPLQSLTVQIHRDQYDDLFSIPVVINTIQSVMSK